MTTPIPATAPAAASAQEAPVTAPGPDAASAPAAATAPDTTTAPDTATAPATAPTVAAVRAVLGERTDPDNPFGHQQAGLLDREERFPEAAVALLDRAGLPALYVPTAHGGELSDHLELVQALRAVASYDLTAAVAHGKTYLGAVCGWAVGDPGQTGRLARDVLAGVPVSWGLTERDHGSDLMAGELTAEPLPAGGYRLTGEKWLINNATRSSVLCLLARTAREGGARGHTLFLVDKRQLPADAFSCLPKVLTHGIRGADISGIALHGAVVPDTARLGREGHGLETVLTSLQLTRTMCLALSLGAADHALSQAVGFTAGRVLYGRRLLDLAHVRRTLGEAYAGLFTAEAVAALAARSVHALPGEMSVTSAVAKAFVPARTDELITACGELLGTRAFLTEVHDHGAFQKLARDHRVVNIFDGNAFVNENALINQLPVLARRYRAGEVDSAGLAAALDLSAAPAEADPSRLDLVARRGASLVQNLPAAVRALRTTDEDTGHPARDPRIRTLAERLLAHTDTLHEELAALRPRASGVPAHHFTLAERYALCFAGAAALQLWTANRAGSDDPAVRGGLWPRAALAQLLARLDRAAPGAVPGPGTDPGPLYDRLFDALHEDGEADAPVTPSFLDRIGHAARTGQAGRTGRTGRTEGGPTR